MRELPTTYGSRGDVRPVVGLAAEVRVLVLRVSTEDGDASVAKAVTTGAPR